jgi:hypothetical protein
MSIEFCPSCSARVRVPVGAEPESWVRCPRCGVENQLREILSAEPPELELIDGPSGEVPSYEPMLAGVAAGGQELNDFNVTAGETLVVDEDSPTLPLGGISLTEDVFDDEQAEGGASIGHAFKASDDELFGFDDNQDVAALRTTTDDGKFMEVPADAEEEFNLSPEAPVEFDAPAAAAAPALGAGFVGMPTGKVRRKKKSGMLPMMIGVVGGGLFGILIAYYGILMWAMGQDPFKVAKYFPEGMQMLLPESLQNKALAGKSTPPPVDPDSNPDTDPDMNPEMPPESNSETTPGSDPTDPTTMPEQGNIPNNESDKATANGEGDTGAVPGLPTLGGADTSTPAPKPMTDPLDALTMPEKPAVDPLDPLASATPTPKPATDPLDQFGEKAPVKPEPTNPDVKTPAVDPLDSLVPSAPIAPPKPEVTNPATDPLDPLAPQPTDPLAVKPIDPLTPQPVDPLAAPPKPKEPLMLADASYAPEELLKSMLQVEAAAGALAQTPEDRKQQAAVYRTLGHVGEVAGQMKSLGETNETAQVNLDSIETMAKKLAEDPTIPTLTKLTAFWLSMPLEKRNNGIVLHGTPGTSEALGKLHKTSLEIPGPDPAKPGLSLSVVSEYPLQPSKDGKVTLLGVIVEKPTEQIPGYTGPAERVIWASVAPMEKPAAPAAEAKKPDQPAPAPIPGEDPFGDIK